ncbi:pseudouridine synthase [Aggregatilineales bacterium SYSU G02658]
MKERVQKLMARADYGSRRACEQMIRDGRVTINGKIAALGDQADPAVDDVRVDGARLKAAQQKLRYYVLNKPRNVLSVTKPQPGDDRRTVRDMVPVEGHLFVIGRLDAESEGLMVLTNDGELAHKLAHPSFQHTKTYKVTVYGHPKEAELRQWEEGVWLDGKKTARCYVRVLEKTPQMTTLRIVMTEGRKRQIREVAGVLGYNVQRLVRTHIGKLGLGTLAKGAWYELSEEEVAAMLMPADELKYIRQRRTFRPKSDAAPAADQPLARHVVPPHGDRSKPARVARSLILKNLHRRGSTPDNPAEVPTAHRARLNRVERVEGGNPMPANRRPSPRPSANRGKQGPPRHASAPEDTPETPPSRPARPNKPKPTPPLKGGRPGGGSRPPVQKGRSNKPPLQRKHGQ